MEKMSEGTDLYPFIGFQIFSEAGTNVIDSMDTYSGFPYWCKGLFQ